MTPCIVEGCTNAGRQRSGLCVAHYRRRWKYGDPLISRHASPGIGLAHFEATYLDRAAHDEGWPFSRSGGGYGQVRVDGKVLYVHAVACERAHGPRPLGMEAAHSCGKRSCYWVEHLRWATRAENTADRLLHGTHGRGERSHFARLTWQEVDEIRRRDAERRVDLASEFGVSVKTISRIVHGRTWVRPESDIEVVT